MAKKEEETVDEEVKRATRAVSIIVATGAVSPLVTEDALDQVTLRPSG